MIRKVSLILCPLVLMLVLVGCGDNPPIGPTPTPTPPTPPAKPTASILCGGQKDACYTAPGYPVSISWSSTDATSCSITGTAWFGTSGSQSSGSLMVSRDYELRCIGGGGDIATSTVKVIVDPIPGGPGSLSFNFTSVPPMGSYNNLKGNLLHVTPSDYRVFCWILVNGIWWPKPTFAELFTTIKADGTWECDITTGGTDQMATEIRAYLVTKSYSYRWPLDNMPSVNGKDVVAMLVAKR